MKSSLFLLPKSLFTKHNYKQLKTGSNDNPPKLMYKGKAGLTQIAMHDSLPSEPQPTIVCACEGWMRSACAGEPFYKEHEGNRYCVLHFPGKEKSADFEKALQRKLENEDFDFRGVWF